MSAISVHELERWEDYAAFIFDFLGGTPSPGRFLFRGHANHQWQLVSSFDRHLPHLLPAQRISASEKLVTLFIEECTRGNCLPDTLDASNPSHALDRAAYAQHFGVPTRLLDWSDSPWIAAYFAYSDGANIGAEQADSAVWILDTDSDLWSDEGVAIVAPSRLRLPRIEAQKGSFTFNKSTAKSIDEYLNGFDSGNAVVHQVILPREGREAALPHLELMGISASSVFPDVDGARWAAMQKFGLLDY